MSEPHAPLSPAERLVWRAAGWLMTGAFGALTVHGLSGARPAAPMPAVAARAAAPAAPAATPATPAPPVRRHHCTRSADG